MIVVDAQLISAIPVDRDANLCRVEIVDDGIGTTTRGNYDVKLYARDNGRLIRTARVEDWPRNDRPAWRLLQAAMEALGELTYLDGTHVTPEFSFAPERNSRRRGWNDGGRWVWCCWPNGRLWRHWSTQLRAEAT